MVAPQPPVPSPAFSIDSPPRILNDRDQMSKDGLPVVTRAFRLRGFANTN
jgi:hypothetical protein